MTTSFPAHFARQYDNHLKHLKLKGLQPKTIDAYARAIRRPLWRSCALLRQADAGDPAADCADGGRTARVGPGSGDGRVSHADRQDGAPIGATVVLGRKMPEKRALSARSSALAGFRR